ncbi:MAG: hypothetical protein WA268_19975 [Xanthobacteraceae bacterium]
MSNTNEDLIECISIRGCIIDLRDVSHELRRQYHLATKGVGRLDRARDELKRVGEAILAEQLPRLAIKYAPAVRGSRAVATRLMELPR